VREYFNLDRLFLAIVGCVYCIGSTEIVIVGDHAPPYVSVEKRALFDQGKVPFLTLVPRT